MVITLDKHTYNETFFINGFLRKFQENKQELLQIDLKSIQWFDEYKLSTFPFVIKQLVDNGVKVELYYLAKDSTADKFHEKLCRIDFFSFCRRLGLSIETNLPEIYEIRGQKAISQFNVFYNIADDQGEVSKEYLYKLTKSVDDIEESLDRNVFGKTDVAKRVANVFCRELIENINQHSKSNIGIVRLNYIDKKVLVDALVLDESGEYFTHNSNKDFFVLCVSDYGQGIIESLRSKYEKGMFIPTKDETLKEMLKETSSYWLKRAFQYHMVPEEFRRQRLGLAEVINTVIEYGGMLYVKSGDASLTSYIDQNGHKREKSSAFEPYIAGTHMVIYMPCVIKMHKDIGGYKTDVKNIYRDDASLVSVDISYDFSMFPISKEAHTSYKKSTQVIEALSSMLRGLSENEVLQIDFSSAINLRANDYIGILDKVYEVNGRLFNSRSILRNVSTDIIKALKNSSFAKKLKSKNDIIFVFDFYDNIFFVGAEEPIESKVPKMIEDYIDYDSMDAKAKKVINRNKFFIRFYDELGGAKVRLLNFGPMFESEFERMVVDEMEKSNAIVDGHFIINGIRHVDNYIIAEQMFRNYYLCRYYAKNIAKKITATDPSVLLSYSNTGVILFFYLKTFYFPRLELCLVANDESLKVEFGRDIKPNDKVLILTDVSLFGNLNDKLEKYASSKIKTRGEICDIISIFEVGNYDLSTKSKCLFKREIVKDYLPKTCYCTSGDVVPISIGPPGKRNAEIPDAYEWHNTPTGNLCPLTFENSSAGHEVNNYLGVHLNSNVIKSQLAYHWLSLEDCFQEGHVERSHVHFCHYDIPERIISKRYSRNDLEYYIKKFVWSFSQYIDYIIHLDDVTATMLAHLVASKFNKKPIIIEVKRSSNKKLIFPRSFTESSCGKNVLIVDDAINTGSTMREMIGGTLHFGSKVLSIFCITSRCEPHVEAFLRGLVPKVAFAYKLNLDVYQSGNCSICDECESADALMENVATSEAYAYFREYVNNGGVKDYERQ